MNKPFIKSGPGHHKTLVNIVDPRLMVQVYKNLHKNCWSIKQGGKVVAHTDYICLRNCKFIVSEKGRQRVLKEKRKNVHATIRGFIQRASNIEDIGSGWETVSYNPYLSSGFKTKDRIITEAKFVDMMIDNGPNATHPVMAFGAN